MKHTEFRLSSKALFGMMVLAAAGAMPVQAATINVNTTTDVINAEDGLCSLREAVIAANKNERSGLVDGECIAGQSVDVAVDVIVLPPDAFHSYQLSLSGEDDELPYDPLLSPPITPDATKGDLDITESVVIQGDGSAVTTIEWADQEKRDRIFHVNATEGTVAVTIRGVTLKNGQTLQSGPLPITVAEVTTNYYLRRAGGAIAVGAAYRMVNPAVSGGDIPSGGGNPNPGGETGASYSIRLDDVVVVGNQAQGDGGGIYTASPLTATYVVVANNLAMTNGGGIYNEGNTSIENSTIDGNTAEGGGGLFLTGSNTVAIKKSTLSRNRAVGGGALSGRSGVTIDAVNSTLSGNLARDVGAGFYHNGPATLNFVTIANNVTGADNSFAGSGINTFQSGSVNIGIKNVLLAANKRGWAVPDGFDYTNAAIPQPGDLEFAPLPNANCGGTGSGTTAITSNGYNLSSDDTCNFELTEVTDIKPSLGSVIDPLIEALDLNNGVTETHALLPGSPALSKGGAVATVTTDQRGEPRESPPDIGAFELDNINEGGGGGGCAVGGEGRFDPTLPAMLAAALALFGWRRRAGK